VCIGVFGRYRDAPGPTWRFANSDFFERAVKVTASRLVQCVFFWFLLRRWGAIVETCRDGRGPILNFGVRLCVSAEVGFCLGLFFDGVVGILREPLLMFLTEALDHIDQIAILAI